MSATVITVSTRHSVSDYDRMVREGLEANGVIQLAAGNANRRQLSLLARVAGHLAMDSRLEVTSGDHLNGYTCVTVWPAGADHRAGIWGEPKGIDHGPDDTLWEVSTGRLPGLR